MSAVATRTPSQDSAAAEILAAVKDSFVYGIGSVLTKVAAFLLLPLYTHYLTPKDYGVFEVLELSMSLLGMFLNMGMAQAILRYYGLSETESQKRKVVGTLFLLTLAISAAVSVAGIPLARPASSMLVGPAEPAIYLALSFMGFLASYIATVPDTALRARGAAGTLATVDTLRTIGLLVLNIYLIAVLKSGLFGMFLGRIIVYGISILVVLRWTHRELLAGIDWKLLRHVVGFGAPLVVSNLSMFVLNFSDRFFLQRLTSLDVVGIYAVGYKFGYLLNAVVLWPFFMMWHARMYTVYQRVDREQVFARIFVLFSFVLVFMGLAVAVFSPEMMQFMADRRYAAGAAVIPVISLSYVLLGIAYFVQVGMYLKSRTGLLGVITAVAALLNLGANYVLILRIGMMGAAWATVLGFTTLAAGSYYYSQRVCPLPLPVGRVARVLGLGLVVYFLAALVPTSSLPLDLLLKLLLLIGYPVLLWACRCFSSDEMTTLDPLRAAAVRLLRPLGSRS